MGIVTGPLETLLPLPVDRRSLPLNVLGRRQAQLQRGRLQNSQHLPCDELIQYPAGQALTQGLTLFNGPTGTNVTRAVQVHTLTRL